MSLLSETLSSGTRVAGGVLVLFVVAVITSALYNAYLSPLSHVPGPFLARCSKLYLITLSFFGVEGRVIRNWHHRYKTSVLRVAPNSVSISDPTRIRDLYITSGGLSKDLRYRNFNLGSYVHIFSAIDTEYRDVRARAVAPLFSMGQLRKASSPGGVIAQSIAEFVNQLQAFKTAKLRMDLVDVCARLCIDIVTGHLLGERYGGLAEHACLDVHARPAAKLSANHFIFAIVAWGRFAHLPHWLFTPVYLLYTLLVLGTEVLKSFRKLDKFVDSVMVNYPTESYHGRLQKAGLSPEAAAMEAKAVVFAGTDSPSVILTSVLFHLTRNPDVRARVLAEIRQSPASVDPRTLPHLNAVIQEGLRLGMANPVRLTREVPCTGMSIGTVPLPPGTVVGCASYTLHHDPDVFPDPFAFHPERWLTDGKDGGLNRQQMDRSMLVFGAGHRLCIGKPLALEGLYQAVYAVVNAQVLDGASTCQDRIEVIEWMNGEIKGHQLEIEWL